MENLTHSLVGGLLAQTALGRKLRYATPTLVIAANLPDADAITVFWGRTTALKHHRGITHSLAGIVGEAFILGGLAFLIERLSNRNSNKSQSLGFFQVFLPILVALLTHPLLDWTNNYGVRPWLPWNGDWYYGDIVFIADPWLWLILGGGLFMVASRNRLQISGWVFLLLVLSLIVLVGIPGRPTNFSVYVKTVWFIGVALMIALRTFVKATGLRSAPIIALLTMIGYWGLLLFLHGQTLKNANVSSAIMNGPSQITALPTPTNPFVWTCLAETPNTIYQINSSVFQNPDWVNATRSSKEASSEMIDKIRTTETGHVFLDFARIFSSTVVRDSDGYTVTLRDLRFGLTMNARFNARLEIVSSSF